MEDEIKKRYQEELDQLTAIVRAKRAKFEGQQAILNQNFKLLKECEDMLFMAEQELEEKFGGLESVLNLTGIMLPGDIEQEGEGSV